MLSSWAEKLSGRAGKRARGVLRFAFYGRVSTEDWQDPVTSRARQLQQALMLTAGAGVITAEFFDSGESRELPWARRPQAAALVAQLADPERGWDAVVIGEYERAFYGNQYASMAPLFEHYGVSLWMPEVGGRVDWHAEDHEQTMLALGLSSKREITRTRVRVRTAMAAQTLEQGRYLGGRPPYGYRLADAGPHPNKAHAAWGRRAHRLEPDPVTAPVVSWMFGQRLAGHSAARITRALNDAGVPCPSAADPGRNLHRAGVGWTLRTVAAILANPRYTGRQVWNRQPSEAVLVDPTNTGLGHRQVQRWNLPDGSSPSIPRTPRWSAKLTSSPPRTPPSRAALPVPPPAGTCSPGSSPAGGAGAGKKRGVAYNYQGQRAGRPHVASWAETEIPLAADLLSGDQDPRRCQASSVPGVTSRWARSTAGGCGPAPRGWHGRPSPAWAGRPDAGAPRPQGGEP